MAGTEAVLLDVDGTLIDSNDGHAHAWVEVGAEFGHEIRFDEVRWLIGMGGDKVLPRLTGIEEDTEEGRRIKERRGEIFREKYLPSLQAFDGAAELVDWMRQAGLRLAVATSASEKDLKALLEQAGLTSLLKDSTNSDDADESKPSPDIVEAALEKAGVPPDRAVMIGDTPYDVEAAKRAGVRIIALTCGGWPAERLREAGADQVFADPADVLRNYERSIAAPPARRGDGGRGDGDARAS